MNTEKFLDSRQGNPVEHSVNTWFTYGFSPFSHLHDHVYLILDLPKGWCSVSAINLTMNNDGMSYVNAIKLQWFETLYYIHKEGVCMNIPIVNTIISQVNSDRDNV